MALRSPSISTVSEAVFAAADTLLVPTIPTELSLRTLKQLARHLEKERVEVCTLPFFCMVDRRKALHRQICGRQLHRSFFSARETNLLSSKILDVRSVFAAWHR